MDKKRIAFLDFMKGIAVIMVVLSHLPDYNTPASAQTGTNNTLLSFLTVLNLL